MPLLLASIPDSARGLFGSLPFRGRNRSSSLPQQQQGQQLQHNGHHHFLSRLSKESTHNLSTNSLFVGPSRDAANTSDEAHDGDSRATPFSRSQATKLSSQEAVHSSASSLISLSSLSTVQSSTRDTLAPKGLKRLHLFHAREWISKSSSSISLNKATDFNSDSSDRIACAQDRNDKENASVPPLAPPSRKRFERAGSFSLHFRSRNGSIASLFSLRTGSGASSLGKTAGAELASGMAAELGVVRQSMSISSDETKLAALKISDQKHDRHDYHHHDKIIPANAVGAEEGASHPSLSTASPSSPSPIMSTVVAQSLLHSSNPTLPPPPPRPTLSPLKWTESSPKGSPKQTKATLSISAPIPTVSCTGLPTSRPPRPPRPHSLLEVGVGKEEIGCGQCRDCNQTALSTRVIPASLPVPEWSHGEVQDRLLGYESYEGVHPLPETVFIRHLLPRGASVAHSHQDKSPEEDTDEENEESMLHQNAVANELYARQRLRALRRHQSTLVRLLGDLLERERDFLCSEHQFRCYLGLVAQTQSRRLKQAFVQERMDQFATRYLRDHRDAIQLTRSRPLRSKACTSAENKNEGGRWWCERCCQQGESVMTPEEKRREAVCIYQGAIVNLWEADQKMCYWLSRYMRTTRRIGNRSNPRTLATTTTTTTTTTTKTKTATTTTTAAMTKVKSKRGAVLSMIGEEPVDCKSIHSVDIDLNTVSIQGRLDTHRISKPLPALPVEATLSKEIKASLDQWSSLSKTLPLFPAPPNFPPPTPVHQQRPLRKQARRSERLTLKVAPPRPPVHVPDEIDAVLSVGRQMERQSKAKGFLQEFNQAAIRAQTLVERLRMERVEYDGVVRRRKGSIITIDGRDFI